MRAEGQIFEWPSRHNIHIALPLFLALSFVIHAGAALLFQATYPPPGPAVARSAQVYFLKPGSHEDSLLQPMLSASDPALFSPAQAFGRDSRTIPDTAYVPSFDAEVPSLEDMPVQKNFVQTVDLPPATAASAAPPAATIPKPGLTTRVVLGGDLSGAGIKLPDNLSFTSAGQQGLAPATFLIGVSADGQPMHVFPQVSSGDEPADHAALAALVRSRLSSVPPGDLTWGTATFLWGADVKRRPHP